MQQISIELPEGYRSADVFAFHGRDAEGVAEQVTPGRIRKGVVLDGVPVALDIALAPHQAVVEIDAGAVVRLRMRTRERSTLAAKSIRFPPSTSSEIGPL